MKTLEVNAAKVIEPNARGWIENHAFIKSKSGEVVKFHISPLQSAILDVWEWCRENNRPTRIIIKKPRQVGVSAVITGILHHSLASKDTEALVVGRTFREKSLLMNFMEDMTEEGLTYWWRKESKCDYDADSSRDADRATTYNILHASEVAMWRRNGEGIHYFLNLVPNTPESAVFIESSDYPSDDSTYSTFEAIFDGAVTLDEARKHPEHARFIKLDLTK